MHKYLYDDEVKEKVRKFVFCKKGKPSSNYFGLPGRECKCVEQALKEKKINRQTKIVYVEKDSDDYYLIGMKLQSMGFKNTIGFNCNLEDVELEKVFNLNEIELAFLDLCGEYSPKFCLWLQRNKDFFKKKSLVSITTCVQSRHTGDIELAGELKERGWRRKGVDSIKTLQNRVYLNYRKWQQTAIDFWSVMMHIDIFGLPSNHNNHYKSLVLYQGKNKKTPMASVTFMM